MKLFQSFEKTAFKVISLNVCIFLSKISLDRPIIFGILLIEKEVYMETRISECRVCHEMFESGTLGRKKRKCNGCIKEGLRVYWRNWQRRKQGILRQGQSKDQGCFVCGYKLTLTKYKEGPVIRFLCPNHYALVMRRIKTMDQLILAKGYLAWLREETEKLTETVFLNMQQKKFSGSVVAPQAPINKTPPVYKMGPKGLMVDNKAQATTL